MHDHNVNGTVLGTSAAWYVRTYVLRVRARRAYLCVDLRWTYGTTTVFYALSVSVFLHCVNFFLAATVDPELCMDAQKIHKCSSVL